MKATVFKGEDGDWYWHLQDGNGKIVADGSEGYHNKFDCIEEMHQVLHGDGDVVIDLTRVE